MAESLSRVEQPTPQERRYAELARRMYEIRDERDSLAASLQELNEWTNRMPDAGFTNESPRWAWRTEGAQIRARASAALGSVGVGDKG